MGAWQTCGLHSHMRSTQCGRTDAAAPRSITSGSVRPLKVRWATDARAGRPHGQVRGARLRPQRGPLALVLVGGVVGQVIVHDDVEAVVGERGDDVQEALVDAVVGQVLIARAVRRAVAGDGLRAAAPGHNHFWQHRVPRVNQQAGAVCIVTLMQASGAGKLLQASSSASAWDGRSWPRGAPRACPGGDAPAGTVSPGCTTVCATLASGDGLQVTLKLVGGLLYSTCERPPTSPT